MVSTDIKRILVPLDGSRLSETALPIACSLAEKYSAQIILLRVVEPVTGVEYVTYPDALHMLSQLADHLTVEAEDYLREQHQLLRQEGHIAEVVVATGTAAESIIEVAANSHVDLIIMSTHGRGGLARWTAGSVADKVLRYCQCPILLVRQGIELH